MRASPSKGFSPGTRRFAALFSSKFLAVAGCVLFIGALTTFYYMAESGFNPYPVQAPLPSQSICSLAKQECPGFGLGNVTLSILNLTDIDSQQVSFTVTAESSSMASIRVYLDRVSLGSVEGPFAPSVPRPVSLGVPTTIALVPGRSYSLVVEAVPAGSGGNSAAYWDEVDVLASNG